VFRVLNSKSRIDNIMEGKSFYFAEAALKKFKGWNKRI